MNCDTATLENELRHRDIGKLKIGAMFFTRGNFPSLYDAHNMVGKGMGRGGMGRSVGRQSESFETHFPKDSLFGRGIDASVWSVCHFTPS